jgi:PAS domain S-box-containing protein
MRKTQGIDQSASDELMEYFRLATEASPTAIVVTNPEGLIQFANAEAQRLFDYGSEELVGQSIDILVPVPLRAAHAAHRAEFFAHPSKRAMGAGRDLKAVRRDGREFPVEIGLMPFMSDSGPLILATVVDVTARRAGEEALARRADELEQANERLAQFAFVASHDLQEPLRKIIAFSDFLQKAIAASNLSEMRYASDVIRASALRARELVDDLLTYSHMINDAQRLQELDLREEIRLVLDDLSTSLEQTGSTVHLDVPPVKLKADRSQFASLLQNILSNAIKYRKPGEPARISVEAAPSGANLIRLAIIDDGIGFEEKFADKIFQPFKRLHTQAQYPGSGIGLAICKSIADRHDWRLSVESRPGEGATFFIDMPTLPSSPAS